MNWILAVGAAALLAGCGGNDLTDELGSSKPLKESESIRNSATKQLADAPSKKLIAANSSLGFRLLAAASGQNASISPLSVSQAMGMVYNGAAGETKTQMERALGYAGLQPVEINAANRSARILADNIDPKIEFRIANSIWVNKNITLEPPFLKTNEESYAAEVSSLDFSNSMSPDTVNGWVSQKTKGRIPTIVDQIPPDAGALLINAVYFKGLWSEPFAKDSTRPSAFHLSSGQTADVPMMHRRGSYEFFERGENKAIKIPFGSNRLSMIVILPPAGAALTEYVGSLADGGWDAIVGNLQSSDVDLALPKFTYSFAASLKSSLANLGMKDLFVPGKANLSMMRKANDLFVQDVIHKTWIQVDEDGAEAAGSTDVTVGVTSLPKTVSFIADRPFVWAIVDSPTGMILFAGVVQDPRAK